jgi:hypothetical protein
MGWKLLAQSRHHILWCGVWSAARNQDNAGLDFRRIELAREFVVAAILPENEPQAPSVSLRVCYPTLATKNKNVARIGHPVVLVGEEGLILQWRSAVRIDQDQQTGRLKTAEPKQTLCSVQ